LPRTPRSRAQRAAAAAPVAQAPQTLTVLRPTGAGPTGAGTPGTGAAGTAPTGASSSAPPPAATSLGLTSSSLAATPRGRRPAAAAARSSSRSSSGGDDDGDYTETDDSDDESARGPRHAGATLSDVQKRYRARRTATRAGAAELALKRFLGKTEPTKAQAKKTVSAAAATAAGDEDMARLIFSAPSKLTPAKAAGLNRQSDAFSGGTRSSESARIQLSRPTSAQQAEVARLNALMASAAALSPSQAAELAALTAKYRVSQFRGYHDSTEHTSRNGAAGTSRREDLRAFDPIGQPTHSSASFGAAGVAMADYYRAAHIHQTATAAAGQPAPLPASSPPAALSFPEMQTRLTAASQGIAAHLGQLHRPPTAAEAATMGSGAGQARPITLADRDTQLYSADYAGHATMRGGGGDAQYGPLAQHYGGLRLTPDAAPVRITGNPRVSTGDVPTHANAYAIGNKAYGDMIRYTLNPMYDADGTPRHPYAGRMHVSLHPPTDYAGPGAPEHLASLQTAGRISLPQTVIPERETPFIGQMPAARIVAQRKAKWPNLERRAVDASAARQSMLLDKYGLSPELHDLFGDAIRQTHGQPTQRLYVERLLATVLSGNHDVEAMNLARQAAASAGAALVVRTDQRQFGFALPSYRNFGSDGAASDDDETASSASSGSSARATSDDDDDDAASAPKKRAPAKKRHRREPAKTAAASSRRVDRSRDSADDDDDDTPLAELQRRRRSALAASAMASSASPAASLSSHYTPGARVSSRRDPPPFSGTPAVARMAPDGGTLSGQRRQRSPASARAHAPARPPAPTASATAASSGDAALGGPSTYKRLRRLDGRPVRSEPASDDDA